jgi:cell division protein FtsI (penicillin-binding protein 3)
MCLVFSGLVVRLGFLHLGAATSTLERIHEKRMTRRNLFAERGQIFDCNGGENVLALSVAARDVALDPGVLAAKTNRAAVVASLADVLDLPAEEISSLLVDSDRRFAYLGRSVAEEKAQQLQKMRLPGVILQETRVRYYPQRSLLCHVLGFVNMEGTGSAGVEQSLERYLRGSPGYVERGVNALRQELYEKQEAFIPAIPGANVTLTIDQNIQHMVEKTLDEVMTEQHAKATWAIVCRVKTGEILAMASRPGFDLNEFRTASDAVKLNRAIGCVYEPGSTFKAVVAAAALNEKMVTPSKVFDCEKGAWTYGGKTLRDFHPYGSLTFADGVKKSSNIMMAKVAISLGPERFYQYVQAFGVGAKCGIDLPGEEVGISHPPSRWSGISITRIPIGQGVAVTALQLLGIYGAIANDGFMMRPFVVKRILAADGSVVYQRNPEVMGRPITQETAATMRTLLGAVTEEGGTGTRAVVEGYKVAGKTGTAQKPVNGSYSATAHIASFVGFLPAEEPEIALVVVVDEPQPCHTGGVVAGPAFSKIAGHTVRYLEIPPVACKVAANNTPVRKKRP